MSYHGSLWWSCSATCVWKGMNVLRLNFDVFVIYVGIFPTLFHQSVIIYNAESEFICLFDCLSIDSIVNDKIFQVTMIF